MLDNEFRGIFWNRFRQTAVIKITDLLRKTSGLRYDSTSIQKHHEEFPFIHVSDSRCGAVCFGVSTLGRFMGRQQYTSADIKIVYLKERIGRDGQI